MARSAASAGETVLPVEVCELATGEVGLAGVGGVERVGAGVDDLPESGVVDGVEGDGPPVEDGGRVGFGDADAVDTPNGEPSVAGADLEPEGSAEEGLTDGCSTKEPPGVSRSLRVDGAAAVEVQPATEAAASATPAISRPTRPPTKAVPPATIPLVG